MNLEQLIAVAEEKPQVMGKAEVIKQNLKTQHDKVSAEIGILEKQLADKKEYLAKIEGGIDVVDELLK
jgi:hypothetical protein|tara:strand:+ start:518 stop:721 length:204 start_codon:yes stop_codon:yes gene_type:complete